ncbi:MAG: division/cell wall cluster transcriptional repressor MraZ [Pseudomonadota bacterium]
MFRGINTINLDAKGRMAVPSRYRELLLDRYAGRLVATIDTQQKCLLLYPVDEWDVIQSELEKLPSFDPLARRAQRMLIGHATDLEMDGNGRILLPQILRQYAGLEKHVALVGQGKKFEIWSEDLWGQQMEVWTEEASGDGELSAEMRHISL